MYDAVVLGAGLSGLSLTAHLLRLPTGVRSVALVDPAPLAGPDRAWAFWSAEPQLLDAVSGPGWDRLRVHAAGRGHVVALGAGRGGRPYRYRRLRKAGLEALVAGLGEVVPVPGRAAEVTSVPGGVRVAVGDGEVRARWCFDSRPRPCRAAARLRFSGWVVRAPRPVFDPDVPTLFDFRVPQDGAARFAYVLPQDPCTALVEHTTFAALSAGDRRPPADALRAYLGGVLGLRTFEVLATEGGDLPLGPAGQRRLGPRTLAIGAAAGMVKPSTGYACDRVQRDSRAIARSLARHGHPFDLPRPHRRHARLDAILLTLLRTEPAAVEGAFAALFAGPDAGRVLRFLDEDTTVAQEALLVTGLPARPFLRAAAGIGQAAGAAPGDPARCAPCVTSRSSPCPSSGSPGC